MISEKLKTNMSMDSGEEEAIGDDYRIYSQFNTPGYIWDHTHYLKKKFLSFFEKILTDFLVILINLKNYFGYIFNFYAVFTRF